MVLKEKVGVFAVKQALNYMDKNPEANLPKLMDWFDKFDVKNTLQAEREAIRNVALDPDSNWYKLIMNLWEDVAPEV